MNSQNNSALRNVKQVWSVSFIQVGKDRTHPTFSTVVSYKYLYITFV